MLRRADVYTRSMISPEEIEFCRKMFSRMLPVIGTVYKEFVIKYGSCEEFIPEHLADDPNSRWTYAALYVFPDKKSPIKNFYFSLTDPHVQEVLGSDISLVCKHIDTSCPVLKGIARERLKDGV